MTLNKFDIVDFFEDRRIWCGAVLESDDRRARLLTEQGKEVKLSRSRILLFGPHPKFPREGSRDAQIEALRRIGLERERLKSSLELAEIWEVVTGEAEEFGVGELADLAFGSSGDPDALPALIRAISEDRIYFRLRQDTVEVASQEQVAQNLARREREREKALFVTRSAEFLRRLVNGDSPAPAEAPDGFVESLEEAALLGPDWQLIKPVKDVFSMAGVLQTFDPFRVLVALGLWSKHENVRLRAEGIQAEFDPAVRAAAEEISRNCAGDFPGEDLTSLHVISVDSPHTRDVDDALSLRKTDEGFELGVHITNAAAFVPHESPLDLAARERGVSIYLPDLMIPMMPPALSEDAASLVVGVPRPAISLLITLGKDYSVIGSKVIRSVVRVSERLSYEEADNRILAGADFEAHLFSMAQALRNARIASGALVFKDRELVVRLSEQREIEVTVREKEAPSQVMVSELMILANNLFARFLRDHKLPGIFRSQPPPVEKIALSDPDDPVLAYRCKRSLARGDLGIDPAPHYTLALDCYTTATSPLRRYQDLVAQRQIVSFLERGAPLLSKGAVERILGQISHALERAITLERERTRYFLLCWLEGRKNEYFEGIALHKFPRFHLIQLKELGMNVAMNSSNGVEINPYDSVLVQIDKISPREDKLSFSLVRPL
jgi:exoribonuclease-2